MIGLFIGLQASGGGLMGMLPLLLMFVIIYFFFIAPQAKKQKQQAAFQKDLKPGEQVVTASGIIGKISKVDDLTVTLNVNDKTSIKFTKGAISKEMTEAYQKGEEK